MRSLSLFAPLFALTLAGCGQSKVDQCNAFIERANKSQTVLSGLKFDGEDASKLEQEATTIEAEGKGLGAVSVSDEKLVSLRNEYVSNLGKLAKVTRDMAALSKDAKEPAKAAALEARLKKLEQDADKIEKAESKLVDDINTYCTGSK